MAEDQTQREILSQLVERLDHIERLLQTQTARLYAVERRLGLESPPPRSRPPLYETLTDEAAAHLPPAKKAAGNSASGGGSKPAPNGSKPRRSRKKKSA